MILGVSEIVLNVDSIPVMREFYERVLTFQFHSQSCHEFGNDAEPDGEPTICFLKITDVDTPLGRNLHPQFLVLIDWRRHFHARKRVEGRNVTLSSLNHLAFEIAPNAYDEQLKRLQALDLEPTRSSFLDLQARAIFFRDPEGNTLELICHYESPR